jgi:O-antigen biosynthesis protein
MISVILPNFNGEALFKAHLKDTFFFFKSTGITDIIIVDDASTDNSVAYLKETFPEIKVLINTTNQGFSYTCNKGAKEANESILLFLNTDMLPKKLDSQFIINQFKNPTLFALSPKIERRDKAGIIINEAITTGFFKGGWFSAEVTPDYENNKNTSPFPVLWACGGACFIDKKKFNTLSGFDTAFAPFYCEDLDISYRAWKQGWEILYTSETSFFHKHQATIGSYFSKKQIDQFHLANLYIFMWKNLTYPPFLLSHIITVLLKIVTIQLRDIKAILRASKKIPYIIKYRASNSASLSDPTILNKWSSHYNK